MASVSRDVVWSLAPIAHKFHSHLETLISLKYAVFKTFQETTLFVEQLGRRFVPCLFWYCREFFVPKGTAEYAVIEAG